ncbi:G patch domain-containing protein 11-like [Watersipora subatra]|uniref:G patch domain-containing protein 11-like n=1 Tax=Watersipora subatra TaxID=2589382 RepID=UPI00355B0BC5
MAVEEEEDYMSAAVLNSCGDVKPGLFRSSKEAHQRLQHKRYLEGQKNKQKPTKVMEAEKREEGLSKSIDSNNKGFALLKKMGYKPGEGIGKSGEGRLEPVGIELKSNRGGLGQEAERRKREAQREKFLEQQHIKKMKMAQEMQSNYRSIKINEQRQRRAEKHLRESQRVCEHLDHTQGIEEPLVFYYWPADLRPGAEKDSNDEETTATEPEDEPEVADQLEELTDYLRSTHLYCIWCGYAFDDAEHLANECPGNTAEDHDSL